MYPLLPVKNRTQPFWLKERDAAMATFVSSDNVPLQADVVIIGSGISGALAAHYVYKEMEIVGRSNCSVVMLEAADLCEGASARNGGHCKPLTYLGFRNEVARHGAEAVDEMYRFEAAHLQKYVDLVREEDLDCDLQVTRACDVFFTQEGATSAKEDYEARKRLFPSSIAQDDIVPIDSIKELEAFSGTKGGLWGCHYPAGHLWPYKLATQVIAKCVRKGMKLYTDTPAHSLTTSTATGKHTITTSRGTISVSSVITTTNAFTAGLLSRFQDRIIPVRGTACSIKPAPTHTLGSLPGPLRLSYGLSNGNGAMDYMICRQGTGRVSGQGDKSYILGGAKEIFAKDLPSWYNNIRDDEQIPGALEYFQSQMQRRIKGWKGEEKPGNVDMIWTGVLGYSNDLLPYVGEMPGRSGLFVSAGFTGHGMPRIPACSEVLAKLAISHMNGTASSLRIESTLKEHIPAPYILTQSRLESNKNYILNLMGAEKPKEEKEQIRAHL